MKIMAFYSLPLLVIPDEIFQAKYFDFKTRVDYGCAKGYSVHALRVIGCDAYGEDISEYAVNNCHPGVNDYISLPNDKKYDLLICKDVLEHVQVEDIPGVLETFKKKGDQFFFTIPLGDDDRFRIREYEVDVTHVTKKDEEWWINMFESHGFKLNKFSYEFGSVKKKWIDSYPYGNGFFFLDKI